MSLIEKSACLNVNDCVEGDYYEFGVFRGTYFFNAYKALKRAHNRRIDNSLAQLTEGQINALKDKWDKMRFFAFDSFEGLPEIEGLDKSSDEFKKGQFACSDVEFSQIIASEGVNLDKTVLIKGWFNETCNQQTKIDQNITKASIVMIDCDLYESTVDCLKFIEGILTDGTIIIFDDFNSFRASPFLGERRAFNEMQKRMPDWVFHKFANEPNHYSRVAFVANKIVK